jgi:Holliday junction resolvase
VSLRKATRPAPVATGGPRELDPLEQLIGSNANAQPSKLQPRKGGRKSRDKGNRIEREIVDRHKALGIHAERYPLSGASRFRGSGHDIDVYLFGREEAPIVSEVKGRKSGAGFVTLEKWLAEFDALFFRRNSADPIVLLPWRVWAQILDRVCR